VKLKRNLIKKYVLGVEYVMKKGRTIAIARATNLSRVVREKNGKMYCFW